MAEVSHQEHAATLESAMHNLKAFFAERPAVSLRHKEGHKSSWCTAVLLLMTMGLAWTGGVNAQEAQQAPSLPSANEQPHPAGTEGSRLTEAERLSQQVVSLYKEGRYREALPIATRALATLEKALGPEHPDVAASLNNLALLYQAQGQYAAAEPLFKRALAIREKALRSEHPDVATSLNNLASLYRAQGQYAAAEPLYRRALAIRKKALRPEHPDVATSLANLASLYQDQGQYAAAELLSKRALAIYEKALKPEHPDVATSLNNLALLYRAQGQYAAAEPLFKRALAIWEKALGPEHPTVARSLNNLASLYQDQGQYAAAELLFKRALAIYEKALGAEHPDVATLLNNLAVLYRAQGQYAAAEPLSKRALAILEKALGPEHPTVARSLDNLAITRWSMDDSSGAVELAGRAAEIQEHNLSIQLAAGSEQQKRQYLATTSYTLDVNVTLHLRAAPDDAKAGQLALTTVFRRKGRALDAMTDQIASLRRHLAPSDRVLLDELAAQRNQLATLILKGPGSGEMPAYRAQISTMEGKAQDLEQKIAARSTSFAAQAQPVTIDRVRRALPADTALVELVAYRTFNPKAKSKEEWGKSHYAAYVLMSEGEIRPVDLGEASTIDHAIGDFGEALANPSAFNELAVKRAGRALDQLVMRPIRALLGNTTRLLVAPDSELNLLPFAALVDEQGRYLVERYSITYLTSGRDLLRMQDRAGSRSAPIVMANPAFDLGGATTVALAPAANGVRGRRSGDLPQRWDSLKGTAQEAAAMKKLMSQMQVLEGRSATESALKRVAGPEMLHIATHGFFLPDEPPSPSPPLPSTGTGALATRPGNPATENPLLRSGLVLAGANARNGGGGEDGILTALEAAGLDLWGTKLVVLSACETGLGQARSGDGVYGLRRSLVLAGAESQLISLWQVDDKATRDLMVAYYQRLLAGEGRSEALRQVQLNMLKKPELRHPNYWAAFIPVGDWRNLKGRDQ